MEGVPTKTLGRATLILRTVSIFITRARWTFKRKKTVCEQARYFQNGPLEPG